MRIKGSDLRKIINEEITRAHRMNEEDDDFKKAQDLIAKTQQVIADNMPKQAFTPEGDEVIDLKALSIELGYAFATTFSKLVSTETGDNLLKSATDEYSKISFSGTATHAFESKIGSLVTYPVLFRFEEMTVDGKTMPQEILEKFNRQLRPTSVIFRITPITFTASFSLADMPQGTPTLWLLDQDSRGKSDLAAFVANSAKFRRS